MTPERRAQAEAELAASQADVQRKEATFAERETRLAAAEQAQAAPATAWVDRRPLGIAWRRGSAERCVPVAIHRSIGCSTGRVLASEFTAPGRMKICCRDQPER